MNKEYFNYHKHTHYSNLRTLDCVVKPIDYIKRAKELGHTSYFTTEHGWQGNLWEAYTLCNEYGLKCISGAEVYYVDDRFNKEERTSYHLIMIALNRDGLRDINRVISKGNTDGFYYKPRIDLDLLLSMNPKNVVITTACVAGRLFKTDDFEDKFVIPVLNHFKDNFFLEVQNHNEDIQKKWNKGIINLSNKYNIPIIHANDSHYIKKEDSKYRDMFLEAKGIIYEDESNFILDYPTYDEIVLRYKEQGILNDQEIFMALENTKIFEKCEDLNIDKEFKIPKACDGDSNQVLWDIIKKEWNRKKISIDTSKHREYEEEIISEYKTIKECNMADYFVLNYNIVNKAVKDYNCILTRSGRGSAVSFLVNKILGLTEVDMMKSPVKLYPSRFMTSERILQTRSLPDIDLNWSSESIPNVIQASKDILGDDNIYYMIAYKPLQESSAFRLWCKAKGMAITEYNDIAKDLDEYVNDPQWKDLIEESKVFRGVIESVAPSPCSFLLLDKPISEEIGLIKVGDQICCTLDGYNCDVYKYLKNDFLSVSVYSLISKTYELIGRPIDSIEFITSNSGEEVWSLFEKGLTATLNQADSDFAKNLIMEYKPKKLSELCAFVAGIRPGFASLLNNFIKREEYSTGVKELDDLLEDSFHYMIYQESVMKVLSWLGIKESETYDIIKKIAKKKFKPEQLEELKRTLKNKWIEHIGNDDKFDETWQTIDNFSKYGFNASHSFSVAIDCLYGAYLKANYPLEYYTVCLNKYYDDIDKTTKIINELEYFDIKVLSPRFRYSKAEYMFDKDNRIIYKGIASIKFLNENVANQLYDLRDKYFNTFTELVRCIMLETSINFKQLKILTKLNYFSEFGKNKKLLAIIDNYEKRLKNKSLKEKTVETRMIELINAEKEIENKALDIKSQMEAEVEFLGIPVITKETLPDNVYGVIEMKNQFLKLYQLNSGEVFDYRVKKTDMTKNSPFGLFNIIRVSGIKKQNKKKKDGDSWITLPNEFNVYISTWDVIL